MRALGKYILSGRMQAIGVVSLLSTLSLMVPPLAFFMSGVPLGLLTLRKGALASAQVMAGSLFFMWLLSAMLKVQLLTVLIVLASVWLPVYACSLVLRVTERPAIMAMAAAVIASCFVLYMYLVVGDVEQWWRDLLGEVLTAGLPADAPAQYQQAIELAPTLMNAVVASSIVTSLVLSVLLARAWQSSLFNPGGFGREFRAFSLPRRLVVPLVLAMALVFVDDLAFAALLRDLLMVVLVLYLVQGLASVHRTVHERGLSGNWLIGMYFLLLFLPQIMVIFVAWIGMTDSLLSRRQAPPGEADD